MGVKGGMMWLKKMERNKDEMGGGSGGIDGEHKSNKLRDFCGGPFWALKIFALLH